MRVCRQLSCGLCATQAWLAAVLFGVRPTLGLPFCLCTGFNVLDWTCGRTNCRLGGHGKNRDAYPHRSRDLQKPLRLQGALYLPLVLLLLACTC